MDRARAVIIAEVHILSFSNLAVSFYMLCFVTLIKPRWKTRVESSIYVEPFNRFHRQYNQTLLFPCSNTSILYKNVTSNKVTLRCVCSSQFVGWK